MLHAQQHDLRALEALVRRHHPRVLRLATRYLGNSTEARDITQDAFEALLKAVPSYRATGRFRAFLYRIVINQCRMARRRDKRWTTQEWSEETENQHGDGAPMQVLRKDIDRAVRQLRPKLRDAVLLRCAGELSYEEVARVLRVPVGTARRRVFAAKAQLRLLLSATQ